jgi:hypothetical protein
MDRILYIKILLLGASLGHGRLQNTKTKNFIQVQDDTKPLRNICRHYRSDRAAPLANNV